MSNTTETARPGAIEHPPTVEDVETVLRERMKTFDQDAEMAEDWPVVKARILKQLKPQR